MPFPPLRLQSPLAQGELAEALARIPTELGIVRDFSPAAVDEADRAVGDSRLPSNDRTDIPLLSIDPAGSTDLDQAFHIARAGDGYVVHYAIADVAAFVSPGGALDVETRLRGQTVYAPDGRIPLHPAVISEGAGSLLAGVERSAYLWEFALDSFGAVVQSSVVRARVHNREQLDYPGAQRAIDDGTASEPLRLLKEVGLARIELERERGGANLLTPEIGVRQIDGRYELERRTVLPVENWNAQLSLLTGMEAAKLMLEAGIGILRTMPPASEDAVEKFSRQALALGHPWADGIPYGDYLRSLDTTEPRQLAIMHAAASLFRGAGYVAFDGDAPQNAEQAAVAAPYTHVTAPLRRLVDRFTLETCLAMSTDEPVPAWVRDALPSLPALMSASNAVSGQVNRVATDTIEAAILQSHLGELFEATVVSANKTSGVIQLTDPAVTATCDGSLRAGSVIRARLKTADLATATVRFELVD